MTGPAYLVGMANVFPKRWTESFQMRVAPEFLAALDHICLARNVTRSEAVRALIDEEVARIASRQQHQAASRR